MAGNSCCQSNKAFVWPQLKLHVSDRLFLLIFIYLAPSTVINLKQSEDKGTTYIRATWEPPEGGHSGYRYCLKEVNHNFKCAKCNIITNGSITASDSNGTANYNIANCTKQNATTNFINVDNQSDGSEFCLCVAALTNSDTLSGDPVAIPAYTCESQLLQYLPIKAIWSIMHINSNQPFPLLICKLAHSIKLNKLREKQIVLVTE